MNYYEILEISQNASPEVIQNAYKTLAKKYHPDVYQGDKSLAEEQMKQINEAYEVLSDPQKRMEYDYQREENCHTGSAYDTSEGTKQEDTSTESSVETAASQSAGKQKRKKPFWALSWIFITFLMFLSIMFEWKWLFVMSLVLGCARFIANKREPAYKTRGLVRVISIGVVGFMIFSCYLMLYDTTITDDDNYIESTLDSRVEMSDINKTNVDTVNTLSEEYSAESAIESITDKIEDEEIRNTINGFVKSINKKDKKDYLEYYHPDCREAVEKSEKAYAFSLAVMKKSNPMIMTRIILDKMDIDVSIKENSVRSQVVYEDEAIVFIEYKISYDSQNIDKPDIVEALIKYSLSESDGKWYITEFTELPLDYDVDIVTNGYDIIKGSNFNEGIAFIGYYKDKAKYTVGAIDIYGNLLFELTDFSEDDELPVIYGGMFLRGNVVYDDTGNIIASPDLSGYDEIWEEKNLGGYVVVEKFEESYNGVRYLFGVIDNKGEWVIPLSEKGMWRSDTYKFTWTNDTDNYKGFEFLYTDINYLGNDKPNYIECDENGHYSIILENFYAMPWMEINQYNNSEKIFGEKFIVGAEYVYNDFHHDMMPGTYHVYDYQGNILLDLSEYNINNWYSVSYYNGYFLFVVENEAGSKYICLIDKEAKPVIDPIKVDNVANVFSGGFYDSGYDCIYYPLDETGFVMLYNNAFCHIDYNGDIIYYDGIYSFSGFYNGLALVKDEFDQMYYINYKGEKVIK